jgi:hypothetical protein
VVEVEVREDSVQEMAVVVVAAPADHSEPVPLVAMAPGAPEEGAEEMVAGPPVALQAVAAQVRMVETTIVARDME